VKYTVGDIAHAFTSRVLKQNLPATCAFEVDQKTVLKNRSSYIMTAQLESPNAHTKCLGLNTH